MHAYNAHNSKFEQYFDKTEDKLILSNLTWVQIEFQRLV